MWAAYHHQALLWIPIDWDDFSLCCQLIDQSPDTRYIVWVSGGVKTTIIMLTDLTTQATTPILTLPLSDTGWATHLYWID